MISSRMADRAWIALLAVQVLMTPAMTAAGQSTPPSIPYPGALAGADVRVPRLHSILDHALLIGNGDINALVWTEGGGVAMALTKNDVWDARLITKNDPPLPTLARIKELGKAGVPIKDPILPDGVTWSGKDSYHATAHPCPRACARLRLGGNQPGPTWRPIRAEGKHNAWQRRGPLTVMSIEGPKDASNGYALEPLALSTNDHGKLRIRLSGTENARYFVDVMAPGNENILGSKWIDTPTHSAERVFDLPPGKTVQRLILYTWTEDGKLAENRFESVCFEGAKGKYEVDLNVVAPPTCAGRLDLRRAVAYVDGGDTGVPQMEARALADRNAFLIRTPAAASLTALESKDLPSPTRGDRDGVTWIEQAIPSDPDPDWPGMRFAVAMAARGELKAVAIVTSFESNDPTADAVKLARETVAAHTSQLVQRHEQAWERFWSVSGIEIADQLLQQTWYRSLYFLRCVSKPGAQCPGLFASLINDAPAWHGDYHTNYNIQQTFWGCYAANHPELAEPYDRLIAEYLPRATWLARQVFSMEGAYYPHVIFAYEPPDPSACKSKNGHQYIHHVWGMTIGVNGFTVQPLWWHYKYAPSRKLLEDTVYPALRETARFYAAFIEQCDGPDKVRLGPSVSPEHWAWTPHLTRNYDCAFDIAMVRYTFAAAIEAAETLGKDSDLVARCRKAMDRLPPYPLHGSDEPIVVDVQGAPPTNYNISVPATPVFPCDVVTFRSSADEKALFTRTIDKLQWNGNNATVMLAVSRARLGMPDTQAWLTREVKARTRPNGTMSLNVLEPYHNFNDFGHYTEQFGAGMAVSELMLQSVADVIRLFPALPTTAQAAFKNLRAQGGFLVSASHENESVSRLEITSTVGGPLRLVSPWPAIEVDRDGQTAWKPLAPDADRIVSLQTKPKETLTFRPGKKSP
ncbi:MAG: hypothetical protein JXQ73_26715 [Phycisphaerae bacterium]|nr:hypothetical protein [Phycisphaerae bacterium]